MRLAQWAAAGIDADEGPRGGAICATGEAYLPFLDALSGLLREGGDAVRVSLLARTRPPGVCSFPFSSANGEMEQLRRENRGPPPKIACCAKWETRWAWCRKGRRSSYCWRICIGPIHPPSIWSATWAIESPRSECCCWPPSAPRIFRPAITRSRTAKSKCRPTRNATKSRWAYWARMRSPACWIYGSTPTNSRANWQA